MQHPIPLQELSPNLHKFCDPKGPVPARMMAAKGMIPLGPADILTVLYMLNYDPDEKIKASAFEKCTSLPENIVLGAIKGDLDPRVLDFYAGRFIQNEPLMEVLLLNQTTADETVARCAKRVSEKLGDIIATNEQRLLRHPPIIENLYNNRNARMSTVSRAIELAVRNGITLDGIAAFKEVAAAIQGELIVEEEGPTPADAMFSDSLYIGDALEHEIGVEGVEAELDGQAPSTAGRQSLEAQIGRMNTSEKIRLALLGTSAARTMLVRDSNKLVALAAIKAPSVKDTEVIAYTRNRSLAEEVIRYISNQKEWTKLYQVKYNLVENPKTPMPTSMTFLTHMRTNDLKNIARSKNVPAAIAQAARNHLRKRQH
jgi:hypothetical protein